MAFTTPLAGTVYTSVDGTPYNVVGECMYDPSSVTRESLVGMSAVDGFSEKPRTGKMKAKFRDNGGLTVASFNAMRNVTVVFQLNNGKTVTGRNMWTVETLEVNPEDATFEVTWEGPQVSEQTSQQS
jgi:hypothetical protein